MRPFHSLVVVRCLALLTLLSLVPAGARAAKVDQVEIAGLHLCCGGCVAELEQALEEVEGVSDLSIDRKSRTARFRVPDAATRNAALEAVTAAGFYGTAMHHEEPVPMIAATISEPTKADRIVLTGVHLCCAGCTKAVVKALEDVESVVAVDCDLKSRTVTLTGKDLDVAVIYEQLHQAGFHGRMEE
ncbi:MAG: heavy-metal-associated domain-containing protein [Pirellulales bacterium]